MPLLNNQSATGYGEAGATEHSVMKKDSASLRHVALVSWGEHASDIFAQSVHKVGSAESTCGC